MNIVINQLDNLALDTKSFSLIPNETKKNNNIDAMLVGSNGKFLCSGKDIMPLVKRSYLKYGTDIHTYTSLMKRPMMIFLIPSAIEENDPHFDQQFGPTNLNNFAQAFSIGCWFIKDSCIASTNIYHLNLLSYSYSKSHRDMNITMSDGTVSQIALTDTEIAEAIKRMYQVYYYLSPEESKMGEIITTYSGDSAIQNIDKATNRISMEGNSFARALLFLQKARRTGQLSSKIENYCSILECLFAIDDKGIKKWLSTITASYLGTDNISREEIRLNMVHAYSIRSESIHGDNIKYLQKHPEIKMEELSTILDNYVRNVFKKIFTEKSLNYSASSQDKTRVKKHFQELATTFYPKESQQKSI